MIRVDPETGVEEYTPGRSLSLWCDISHGKELEVSVFTGHAKNLGTRADFRGPTYGRGMEIEKLWRVSPRTQWNAGKTRFSLEVEHTSACHGVPNGLNNGRVEQGVTVANTPVLLPFWLFF